MSLQQRLTLLLVTTIVFLIIDFHNRDVSMAAPAEGSFKTEICQFLCTKDPPEGGNFCNCDRHPLGKRSLEDQYII